MGSSSSSCSGEGIESKRGIFECDEDSQSFSEQHALQDRQMFTDRDDQEPIESDIHQQVFLDCTDQYCSLTDEIDQWERKSIDRIRQTARKLRRQVKISVHGSEKMGSNKSENVSEDLCKIRQGENFAETTATRKRDLLGVSSSLTLREDPVKVFIPKLYLIPTVPEFVPNESLVCISGDVEITDEGRAAKNIDTWVDVVQLQGKGEYSAGIHKLRFIIGSKSPYFHSHFGIVSKFTSRSQKLSGVGWTGEKISDGPHRWQTLAFSQGHTNEEIIFEIALTIDCENQIIRFLNERTNKTDEKFIDTSEWPFPWQLFFDLIYTEDRVQLLSSDRA